MVGATSSKLRSERPEIDLVPSAEADHTDAVLFLVMRPTEADPTIGQRWKISAGTTGPRLTNLRT